MRPHPKMLSALIGGLVATSVVTVLVYTGPAFGLDPLGFASLLGALIVGPGASPAIGLVIHLVNGSIVLPAMYVFLVFRRLAGPPWLRGIAFGVALWAIVQALLTPGAGEGFFSSGTEDPLLVVGWSLATHVLYGLILGAIARPRLAQAIEEESDRQSGRRVA